MELNLRKYSFTGQIWIAQKPSANSLQSLEESVLIFALSFIETKRLLIQIPEKVEGLNTHISALYGALQQRPEILHSIGVNMSFYIFLGMIDDLVVVWTLPVYEISKQDDNKYRVITNGENYVDTKITLYIEDEKARKYVEALNTGSFLKFKGIIKDVSLRTFIIEPALPIIEWDLIRQFAGWKCPNEWRRKANCRNSLEVRNFFLISRRVRFSRSYWCSKEHMVCFLNTPIMTTDENVFDFLRPD